MTDIPDQAGLTNDLGELAPIDRQAGDLLVRLVRAGLALYLLPVLLVVLIVGSLGLLVEAVERVWTSSRASRNARLKCAEPRTRHPGPTDFESHPEGIRTRR